MSTYLKRAFLVQATGLLLIAGLACDNDKKPTSTFPPPIVNIPLKVRVILNNQASDVFDQAGFEDNQGCRLSRQNILDYVHNLQNNAHIFGANFKFTWDDEI